MISPGVVLFLGIVAVFGGMTLLQLWMQRKAMAM